MTHPQPDQGEQIDELISDLIAYEPCDTSGCNGKCHEIKHSQAKAQFLHLLQDREKAARLDGAKQPISEYNLTTAIAVKSLCEDRIAWLAQQEK